MPPFPPAIILSSDTHKLKLLTPLLKETYTVYTVDSERRCWLETREKNIGLIFLDGADLQTPPFPFIEKLHKAHPYTPIILITSSIKQEFLQEAFLSGATAHISDRLTAQEIETALVMAMQFQETERKIDISSSVFKAFTPTPTSITNKVIMPLTPNSTDPLEIISLTCQTSISPDILTNTIEETLPQGSTLAYQGNLKWLIVLPKMRPAIEETALKKIVDTLKSIHHIDVQLKKRPVNA